MTDLEHLLHEHGSAPEHSPRFEERLWAAIAVDAVEPLASAGEVGSRTRTARHRRRARSRLVVLLAAALAAAALMVSVTLTRHTVQEYRSPAVASAAEVAAHVSTALSTIRTLRAETGGVQNMVFGPDKSEWQKDWTTADWWARARVSSKPDESSVYPVTQIVATADGRWRHYYHSTHPKSDMSSSFDSSSDDASGVSVVCEPWSGLRWMRYVSKNTSLGPPDDPRGGRSIEFPLEFVLPSNIAAMAQGRISETTYDGRPALTVSCPIAPQPLDGRDMGSHWFDTVAYTVDRETWIVVRTSYLLHEEVVLEQWLTDVHVNEPVSDAQLEPTFPNDAATEVTDLKYRRVSFGEAARMYSTRPLEPKVLPEGFHSFAAAVADKAKFSYFTYTDGYRPHYLPPSREVTQLSYRAGLLKVIVTTRAQRSGGALPDDLFVADPFIHESVQDNLAAAGEVEKVKLSGGVWRGVTAFVAIPLLDTPHLWAWHDGVLVTVGGDLTRDQLLAVANSLEPMD
jgi:hypothetical protein